MLSILSDESKFMLDVQLGGINKLIGKSKFKPGKMVTHEYY